jgi:hypothetical protein
LKIFSPTLKTLWPIYNNAGVLVANVVSLAPALRRVDLFSNGIACLWPLWVKNNKGYDLFLTCWRVGSKNQTKYAAKRKK